MYERVADRSEHQPGERSPTPRPHNHQLRPGRPADQLDGGMAPHDDPLHRDVRVLVRPRVELCVQEVPRAGRHGVEVEKGTRNRIDRRDPPGVHGDQRCTARRRLLEGQPNRGVARRVRDADDDGQPKCDARVALLPAHHNDRARCVRGQLGGDRTREQATQPRAAARPHDDELGAPGLGSEDHLGRTDEHLVVYLDSWCIPLGEPRSGAQGDLRTLEEELPVAVSQVRMPRPRRGGPVEGVHQPQRHVRPAASARPTGPRAAPARSRRPPRRPAVARSVGP
ncbi:hypothetical protein BJF90_35345 [Pseudonocardia sp. CNS-004]|nr:hypothetical protein BJF90_35345 [Pseudonocardia sp. CNS-004]